MWYTSQVIIRNMKLKFLDVNALLHYISIKLQTSITFFSPKGILEEFGYVVFQKILHLMIPNVSLYHFFPSITLQQPYQ